MAVACIDVNRPVPGTIPGFQREASVVGKATAEARACSLRQARLARSKAETTRRGLRVAGADNRGDIAARHFAV
jgi:hypothetical protein